RRHGFDAHQHFVVADARLVGRAAGGGVVGRGAGVIAAPADVVALERRSVDVLLGLAVGVVASAADAPADHVGGVEVAVGTEGRVLPQERETAGAVVRRHGAPVDVVGRNDRGLGADLHRAERAT